MFLAILLISCKLNIVRDYLVDVISRPKTDFISKKKYIFKNYWNPFLLKRCFLHQGNLGLSMCLNKLVPWGYGKSGINLKNQGLKFNWQSECNFNPLKGITDLQGQNVSCQYPSLHQWYAAGTGLTETHSPWNTCIYERQSACEPENAG